MALSASVAGLRWVTEMAWRRGDGTEGGRGAYEDLLTQPEYEVAVWLIFLI